MGRRKSRTVEGFDGGGSGDIGETFKTTDFHLAGTEKGKKRGGFGKKEGREGSFWT